MLSFKRGHFALRFHRDGPRQVALGHGGGHFRDGAHLCRQVGGQLIHVIRQVLPGSGGARHAGLAAQFSFDTHFAGHRGHLIGERRQRVDHVVDRVGQFGDFALGVHRQFSLQVAVGDGRHDVRDTAHLVGQVAGHEVHVVRQVLPRTGDAFALRPVRPVFLPYPLRGPRASLPTRRSSAGPPSC